MSSRIRIAFMGPNDGGRMHQGAQAFKALEYYARGVRIGIPPYPAGATRLQKMKLLWRGLSATAKSSCHFVVVREHRDKPWRKSQARPLAWGLQPAHKKPQQPSIAHYYNSNITAALQQQLRDNAYDWSSGKPKQPPKPPRKRTPQLQSVLDEINEKRPGVKKKKPLNIGVWA